MKSWPDLLQAAVSPLEAGVRDLQVNGFRPPQVADYRPNRTAAVLVPILALPEPEIVLTLRADHLPDHPGQISFPGGAAEDGDASAVHTALREAQEEIGLPPAAVRPIGFLDRMDTISDYRILPVVALVTPPVEWQPDKREVAEVFTVPVSVALDADRYQAARIRRHGQAFIIHSLNWQGYNIWGATAGMLMNLIIRLRNVGERAHAAHS